LVDKSKFSLGRRIIDSTIALAFLFFLGGGSLSAQTVRPLINELRNPAKGRVEYVNDSLTPLNVVVQAQSFTVSDMGEMSYRPLDSNIHLKLSATSFRIPPQQSYYLFYEASTDKAPAWFVIYATFSGFAFRTQQGMAVRLELPHTVYLLPKESLEKSDVHINIARYDPDSKKVVLEVENTGPNFGRIVGSWIEAPRQKQEVPGFPVFPQSRRRMEYNWSSGTVPEKILLDFDKFKVENAVSGGP
jgi:hypothetical protein